MTRRPPRVVISAGFNKTHMTTAAREVYDRGQLALAITGLYPTPLLTWLLRTTRLSARWRMPRLLERDEAIPSRLVKSLALPELVWASVRHLVSYLRDRHVLSQRACVTMWRLYGWRAARELTHLQPRATVYHYRAGYGQSSIDRARRLGMCVVCDQALAHPAVLDALVAGRGQMPQGGADADSLARLSPIDRAVLHDIERSDAVVVNSDFVKESFLACGWAEHRVHVVSLGIDENFLRHVPPTPRRAADGPLRLLFAGRFERRKGADVIAQALSGFQHEPWELAIAGPIEPKIGAQHRAFLADRRVKLLGSIPRRHLAGQMLGAEVLLLPSYAEGSARVVFEALACGCYVIATPNSGSVVEDGVHGALIPPGNTQALRDALRVAWSDRARLADIGNRNAALVRERHRQSDYGNQLSAVYAELVGQERASAAVA